MLTKFPESPGTRHWLVLAAVASPVCDNPSDRMGKERRNLLTETQESSHAKGWARGGDRHCPLPEC